ncbi:MAG: hypothetical protein KGM47_09760, partial [Acidobacteriota bacterium]|nr:hypothetical protein [Acidobacteriota bacterium]
QALSALRQQDYTHARDLFQQVVNLNVPGSAVLPRARQELASVSSRLQDQQNFSAAAALQSGGQLAEAQAKFQSLANQNGPFAAQAKARLQQIGQTLAAEAKKKTQSEALQASLAKFRELEGGGQFGAARALIAGISGQGGDSSQLESELNQRETTALQTLTTRYDEAAGAKDTQQLKSLASEFHALSAQGGSAAAEAQHYAAVVIPADLKQIEASEKPAAPAAPAAVAPQVTVLTSGNYQPWRGPVRRDQLLPEYNIDGGLKAVSLAVPAVRGAPPGSVAIVKINIDATGSVTPDHVINDTSGKGPLLIEACRHWKFRPPSVRGKPVRTSVSVEVKF